ncbi:hypothetical protein D3218_16220 [Aureimonas flava]|uniref:YfdX family protein n=1 Tax=Aureimonas flava TaxID=2320271 RepID=A0A3A1WNR6_9HYPH|nr:hypothetical protein D3218_16220 [Aureimonas flava]
MLLAGTVVSGAAYAADQGAKPASTQETRAEKAVDKDVGRLSADGAQAMRDIQATRLAIFDARPDDAKTLIGQAQDAMRKAAKDDAVFTKVASQMEAMNAPATAKTDAKTGGEGPVAWVPVDTQLSFGADFKATPEKVAAVTEASKSLQSDRHAALEKLKLVGDDVQFVTAVVPLDRTTGDVGKAADLIGQGKYYEANAVLKDVTDQVRLDVVDIYGQPVAAKTKDKVAASAPAPAAKAATPETKAD